MSSCHARPKPFLKTTHRAKRLAWAHEVEGWTMKEWENIIWTDESSVELGKNSRVDLVWRHPNEAYSEKCTGSTIKSGRTSIMVWGAIAYGWRGPLIFIPKDHRTGKYYVSMVLTGGHFFHFMRKWWSKEARYMLWKIVHQSTDVLQQKASGKVTESALFPIPHSLLTWYPLSMSGKG